MTYGRSHSASLYALCCGIWMFASKAPNTLFRVESRIGQCAALTSVIDSLREMSKASRELLKHSIRAGKRYHFVFDNVQTFTKPRE